MFHTSSVRTSALAALALAACGGTETPPKTAEEQALLDVKAYVGTNLGDLVTASTALCAAAPAGDADGWDATHDAAAVDAMKTQWKKARVAYEHVEGAIAVLFPELDVSTDERYDGFLADFGKDDDLFDDQGVTGIHAIERILWSDAIPAPVKAFEEGLDGYVAPAFPANQAQATAFKTKLCARLVTDVTTMQGQFAPLALDPAAAYRGVVGSMKEQVEKAEKAASGEEESRYARYTLADMRANVAAGKAVYAMFRPWLLEKGGQAQDTAIGAAFARLDAAYAAQPGDDLPPVPEHWSSANPSAEDLQTDFGRLYAVISKEADDQEPTSLVAQMAAGAQLMGIPALP